MSLSIQSYADENKISWTEKISRWIIPKASKELSKKLLLPKLSLFLRHFPSQLIIEPANPSTPLKPTSLLDEKLIGYVPHRWRCFYWATRRDHAVHRKNKQKINWISSRNNLRNMLEWRIRINLIGSRSRLLVIASENCSGPDWAAARSRPFQSEMVSAKLIKICFMKFWLRPLSQIYREKFIAATSIIRA